MSLFLCVLVFPTICCGEGVQEEEEDHERSHNRGGACLVHEEVEVEKDQEKEGGEQYD